MGESVISSFPLLTFFVFAPAAGALLVLCMPGRREDIVKTVAAAIAAGPLAAGAYLFASFPRGGAGGFRFVEEHPWIASMGISYRLGADGLSAAMICLSGLVGFLAVVASWGMSRRVKGYLALLLLLMTAANGAFCALDLFLFCAFFGLMPLPAYFLIGGWGSKEGADAALRFFLYSMCGFLLLLIATLGLWFWSDGRRVGAQAQAAARAWTIAQVEREKPGAMERIAQLEFRESPGEAAELRRAEIVAPAEARMGWGPEGLARTFDMRVLPWRWRLYGEPVSILGRQPPFHLVLFLLVFIGLAAVMPAFPLHTWMPRVAREAPAPVALLLMAVGVKIGIYGLLRIGCGILPQAAATFAVPLGILGVINILYGALCAMAQKDLRRTIGYAAVSQIGFCLLGAASLTAWGMTGSVAHLFAGGLGIAMLLLLAQAIRDRGDEQRLTGPAPLCSGAAMLAAAACLGVPGTCAFASEFLVVAGAFGSKAASPLWKTSFQSLGVLGALGLVLGAAYLLRIPGRAFAAPSEGDAADLNGREALTVAPLAALAVAFGVYPAPVVDLAAGACGRLAEFVERAGMMGG